MNKLFAIIAVFGLAFVFAGCPSSSKTGSEKSGSEPAKTGSDAPAKTGSDAPAKSS